MATNVGDTALISRAMLALAQAQVESGDITDALKTVNDAQERFAKAGQQESEWRACATAARAFELNGDKSTAQQRVTAAGNIVRQLQEKWGEAAFSRYSARPDIQVFLKQLGLIQ